MLHGLVMAGGGGTRFWPRSRQKRPKQFLTLVGERSLLQQAVERIEALIPPERTWIITSAAHRDEVARQLPQVPPEHIVGEPCGRDTAACIGLGAALIHRQDAEATMLVTPADHVIEPVQEFRRAVHVAEQVVLEQPETLVIFGIPPTYPATVYGYIQRGAAALQRQGLTVFAVQSFREKPRADLAEQMFASGQFFWNAGIFCWKARTIRAALQANRPELAAAVERIAQAWGGPQSAPVFEREYERAEKISIDYAVMEKARSALVVQAPFRWDDVGAWQALERMHPQDKDGNTVLANHLGLDTKGCIVVADPGVLVTTVGVENLLVVQDGDAILVADRGDENAVKKLVEALKARGLEKYL